MMTSEVKKSATGPPSVTALADTNLSDATDSD